MPRRRRESGPSLESDSFLDIVANIVGILIILIVVVGVRVGQSASAEKQSAQKQVASTAPAPAPVIAPRPRIVVEPAPAPSVPEASPELVGAIATAQRDVTSLQAERASLRETSRTLDAATAKLTARTEQIAAKQQRLTAELASTDRGSSQLEAQIDELHATLETLSRQISDVPTEKTTVLRHRLNPLGRKVRGEELHFRIAEGRVARVPIKELVDLLKPEIEREKEWIAKYHRHRGQVGPIDGFSMDYVVERERLSVVEQLQQSSMMMRISVSGWKMIPEPNLTAETADEALRGDSAYLTALRLAEPGTTLTFWVYPDSFEAYRKLQEHAHDAGFAVAARPLPHGVPIAGSPNGSRSSSQ